MDAKKVRTPQQIVEANGIAAGKEADAMIAEALAEGLKLTPQELDHWKGVAEATLVSELNALSALERIAALTERVEQLEGRGLKYVGTFQRANPEGYQRGDVVTSDGSAWIAVIDAPTGEPGKSAGWQLLARGAR